MTILSDRDIVAAIDEGRLGVGPWNDRSLTPNGYDLRVAEISVDGVVHGAGEGAVRIPPKTVFFVSTIERVRFPDDMCGNLWLRTSWIRKGVISAFGMVDAGFEGTLTLGSYNSSDSEIEIPIGERYCQLVFQTMSSPSEKSYEKRSGHYQNQTGVTLRPRNPRFCIRSMRAAAGRRSPAPPIRGHAIGDRWRTALHILHECGGEQGIALRARPRICSPIRT